MKNKQKKTFVYVHGKFIVYMNIGNKIISKLDRNIHDLSKPCRTLYLNFFLFTGYELGTLISKVMGLSYQSREKPFLHKKISICK